MSDTEGQILYTIPLYEISRVDKYIEIEISVVVASGWQEGEIGVTV